MAASALCRVNQMFKQKYDKMCFDCEVLAGNFGRERRDWLACVNVFSLIFLISCLCRPKNMLCA